VAQGTYLAYEAKLDEEMIYWGAKLACVEMIRTGTTTFNDMYCIRTAQNAQQRKWACALFSRLPGWTILTTISLNRTKKRCRSP
jgi:cytosine/adenosine deaminase-related metal-dependent hydrolase